MTHTPGNLWDDNSQRQVPFDSRNQAQHIYSLKIMNWMHTHLKSAISDSYKLHILKTGRQAQPLALQIFYLSPGYPKADIYQQPCSQSQQPHPTLTTGRCTSQNARSWLSRIFLSILSLFLSTLAMSQDI